MILPPEMKVGKKLYVRTPALETTKTLADKKAKQFRKEGHFARIIKNEHTGKWTCYVSINSKAIPTISEMMKRSGRK